jgi:putative endonuclease
MWNYNFYVYITTNPIKTVLYVGVTNDLNRRIQNIPKTKATKTHLPENTIAII